MNKFTSFIKKTTVALAAAVVISASVLTAGSVSAIPYTSTDPGTTYPAFNVYTGVPGEGNESDFLRGKDETDPAASVSTVNSICTNGTNFRIRVYVHNAANQTLNDGGNGSGVARGSRVRVALPANNTQASSFNLSSVISASNATSVGDSMTINCGGKIVQFSYVSGSARQFTGYSGTTTLSDSIVTTGTPIGTVSPNGDVWGCFGQRVFVTFIVRVLDIGTPPPTTGNPIPTGTTPGATTPTTPVGTTPTRLPDTGPGDVIAIFLAVTAASTVGYYTVARRRATSL